MTTSNRNRAAAEASADAPIDWAGATVETAPAAASVVYSTRLDADLARRLVAQAERRGIKPAALLRELVAQGLPAYETNDDEATVRLADLRQAVQTLARTIETAARRAA
ncbi:MAG TPA: hypothetical protein VNV66_08160 [Pilimelia sp.]|nr:hypothetical protein [Pilimelia sp.]